MDADPVRSDSAEVVPNLFMGRMPPPGHYPIIHTLVLAAKEYQPLAEMFPGTRVIHAPLDDNPKVGVLPHEAVLIDKAAQTLARRVKRGQRVLVTCAAGLNRSGVIVATTIRCLYPNMSADQAIRLVRCARGPVALSNPAFVKLIQSM